MKKRYDVAIIGGGASGMAAAIELKMSSPDFAVIIIEKNDELGRKIRATGNGRCNITNKNANGYLEIMKFFMKIGLMTRSCDSDLVYPYSESAADVVDLLTARLDELGVDVMLNTTVCDIEHVSENNINATAYTDNESSLTEYLRSETEISNNTDTVLRDSEYSVRCNHQLRDRQYSIKCSRQHSNGSTTHDIIDADQVILAVGGKAGPSFGTTGDGYALARKLGHTVVTPIPVLTPVECAEWDKECRPSASSLAGIRARGIVSLYCDETGAFTEDTKVFEEAGEIQFTKYGLSGICIFNMTRFMRYNRADGETLDQFRIRLNLFPEGNIRELEAVSGRPDVLRTILKKELADYVNAHGIDSIHDLTFTPTAVRGWKDAQVTSGGVDLGEIDPMTCESRLQAGLYITGELLDYDGPCGGYNLSNAWLTGLKAAKSIAAGTH